jgi:hypothetical protein
MASMIIPEVRDRLNQLAQEYAQKFDAKIKEVLSKKKYRATGDLAASVKTKVVPATDNEAPQIVVEYLDYGELINKRRLIFTKIVPADDLFDFVSSSKFKRRSIPGYREGVTPGISQEAINRRIAFAIGVAKKRDQKHRRRPWKRDSLRILLEEMNTELVEAWSDVLSKELAKSISNK